MIIYSPHCSPLYVSLALSPVISSSFVSPLSLSLFSFLNIFPQPGLFLTINVNPLPPLLPLFLSLPVSSHPNISHPPPILPVQTRRRRRPNGPPRLRPTHPALLRPALQRPPRRHRAHLHFTDPTPRRRPTHPRHEEPTRRLGRDARPVGPGLRARPPRPHGPHSRRRPQYCYRHRGWHRKGGP